MCNSRQNPVSKLANDLFPSQKGLIDAGYLVSNAHWIVSAPTGSGKTRMGEWALERALNQGYRAAYIAPLKAIVEERLADWGVRFKDVGVGAFTGATKAQSPPQDERLLLFTPEKLASYLSSWKNHLRWISEIDVLLIDELHLLGDPSRGPTLETLIGRLERANPFVRIVGLSATIENAPELSAWLGAENYRTDWRPVPVTHRLQRFKRAADKPGLLIAEVLETIDSGGRTLVFVNSRRRAEALAAQLRDRGLRAAHTHAGLSATDQQHVHQSMRQGSIDTLVATSTLEMGVNLPARKVVIYDSYAFEGETFKAMSHRRYLQFAGRAGRAGLDPYGEAVLFAPQWDGDAEGYLNAKPDPVRSALFSTTHLQREILYEVSSRLSVSETHLETNFAARTLWRHQGGSRQIGLHTQALITAGLLRIAEKADKQYLSATTLGRIATQMSLTPATVILMRNFFERIADPYDFDVLLITCLSEEVTPKLGFNFEEIDEMADLLLDTPSRLLDLRPSEVLKLQFGIGEKRLLSAIKCATLLLAHTQLNSLDVLAERFDCYPSDLQSLKRNSTWIMEAAHRIFSVLNRQQHMLEYADTDEIPPIEPSRHEAVTEGLKIMVEYGVHKGALDLVRIAGVGPKRAQRICDAGIFTVEEVINLVPEHLAEILASGHVVAAQILASAQSLPGKEARSTTLVSNPRSLTNSPGTTPCRRGSIDPYRLRRAVELVVDHCSPEVVRVSGGAEPHSVRIVEETKRKRSYICDCADFEKGHPQCKHVLRARLALHDDADLQKMLKQFAQAAGVQPLRLSVTELWMKVGKSYDAFNSRKVDYTGTSFVSPTTPAKRHTR
jgi:helicase